MTHPPQPGAGGGCCPEGHRLCLLLPDRVLQRWPQWRPELWLRLNLSGAGLELLCPCHSSQRPRGPQAAILGLLGPDDRPQGSRGPPASLFVSTVFSYLLLPRARGSADSNPLFLPPEAVPGCGTPGSHSRGCVPSPSGVRAAGCCSRLSCASPSP